MEGDEHLNALVRAMESRPLLTYGSMLGGVVAIYQIVRALGNTLAAPPAALNRTVILSQAHVNDFLHLLLAVAVVIAAARSLGALCQWLQQPPVIGEMIAGILLGPSLLGQLAPTAFAYLLPAPLCPF